MCCLQTGLPGSCFRGDVSGGNGSGSGSGSIDPTLMDYNSWTSSTQQQQQPHTGPAHPSSNLQPVNDHFSRRIIGNVGVGGTNDESHFANAWNAATPNDRANQWSRNSMPLWSSSSVVRADQSDSPNGARLGGVMGMSTNPESSVELANCVRAGKVVHLGLNKVEYWLNVLTNFTYESTDSLDNGLEV
ncbi:unnamed protein product [Hydatigera taeniaeformis]|uniref:TNRC6-PABC_bdg domain-containing protein n=1 Tax=Hydatigena taeniaeformis TaxID=6205 RepID=A0A0R3XBB5_HYDTA|nr:unnamed protein product [Hydatigera taeniaeformis]